MNSKVDLYNTSYDQFAADAQSAVRAETYGEDIGQSSWMTADELRHFIDLLEIDDSTKVLEVGSGSGGPALFTAAATGCSVVGVDVNEFGIGNANKLAKKRSLNHRAEFRMVQAGQPLPFDADSFDVVFSNDVICHIPDRQNVLIEWHRILKPGGRMLFTDALVITGIVSYEEIVKRSSVGRYFYLPAGENERMIKAAGFEILRVEDSTQQAAEISKRWFEARERHRDAMLKIESEENFNGLQEFLAYAHTLTSERRLSRYMYLARKSKGDDDSR